MKKWTIAHLNKERATRLAEEWDIPFFLAMLLDIRGMTDREKIEAFFNQAQERFDPFALKDMDKAVQRIEQALDLFEKICVYGDYDADGVTATALLYSYLESRAAHVMYYIPEREGEGYGLNVEAVEKLKELGVQLIITVDNGIASVQEVEKAAQLGVDVVITDHHQPQGELPKAVAVVDPHQKDGTGSFRPFAGVGVAFQLIMALEGHDGDAESVQANYGDLAAIGTIGDVVPLEGENRLLVKEGLKQLTNADRVGIRALLAEAGLEGKKLSAGNVAYTLVPRINAAGRMGSSDKAVRLLLSEFPEEADSLAIEIGEENRKRQSIESDIFQQAEALLKEEQSLRYDRVLVLAKEGWHPGVIGIVASRLMEKYGRPCMMIGIDGEEAKGSGRSIAGFSLYDAVFACQRYLTRFGGHPMAAGLSMHPDQIPAFRAAINRYAAEQEGGMPNPELRLDCKLNPAALSLELVEQMSMMEPFGSGNPTPLFGLFGMSLMEIQPVGGGKHLRLTLSKKETQVVAMRFSTTREAFPYEPGDVLDLAVTLDRSEFRGVQSLSVIVRDLKLSSLEQEQLLREQAWYETAKRGEYLPQEALKRLIPNRDEFAVVYRYLRKQDGWHFGLDVLISRLRDERIGYGKLAIILDMMQELGLITLQVDGAVYHVLLQAVNGKVDLQSSSILIGLNGQRKCGERYAQ